MNPRLESIQRIILSIGHGGLSGEKFDPGVTNNITGETENKICRKIAMKTANLLTQNGLIVLLLPDHSLESSIQYINYTGDAHTDWAIEIHKDSTDNFSPQKMINRMGVYYHPVSKGSKEIAEIMIKIMKENGAGSSSWARPDTDSNHGTLGWIRQPKMLSHIIESGFIEDKNDESNNELYAKLIAVSICRALDKKYI